MSTSVESNPLSAQVSPSILGNSSAVNDTLSRSEVSRAKSSGPRIIVPAATAARALGKISDEGTAVSVVTPKGTPSGEATGSGKEKVGRWTEEEHLVFLEGLEKHGKQWKVIAGMIGTRTVVQVRTHAQKYFQRMERHSDSGSVVKIPATTHTQKRKMSLPASLPSRQSKKPKGSPSKKSSLQRAASTSLVSSASPTHELPTCVSYVSNTSSMSSETSWSAFSPTGVAEANELYDVFHGYASKEAADDGFDFTGLAQDPLAWLVDAEPSILPESSLPVFPDLSSGGDDGHFMETDQIEPHIVEDSTSHTSAGDHSAIDESILNSIADPNVTVQSLFLPPDLLDN